MQDRGVSVGAVIGREGRDLVLQRHYNPPSAPVIKSPLNATSELDDE